MRGGIAFALLAALLVPDLLLAQYQPPSQTLLVTSPHAATWTSDDGNVIQLHGPVDIEMDRAHLRGRNAVIWLARSGDHPPDEQTATIALLGDARLEQTDIVRSGENLIVTADVRGTIRINANERVAQDLSNSPIFQEAVDLRATTGPATTRAAPASRPTAPILIHGNFEGVTAPDGKLALVFTNGVSLSRKQPNGDLMEMQAERGVLFSTVARARDAARIGAMTSIEQAITAAYLEGDVRIVVTPVDRKGPDKPEQRLEADRVYYEFTTDRAILTKAVIHTLDPSRAIPLIVRAQVVHQLSQGEFTTKRVEMTTSAFAIPTYSINADRAYIRSIDTNDPRYGTLTQFVAHDAKFEMWHIPWFYLPAAAGEFTERGMPLRTIEVNQNKRYGVGVRTEWGLLEALGILPPPDLDVSLRADYFSDRGPAAGIDSKYGGGLVSETTRQAWNFQGALKSYFLFDDTGADDLGRKRSNVQPDTTFRGRVRWDHQQFLPNDWQVQLSTGWVSDPTFLEEWFEREFNDGPALETAFYAKRQRGTEAMTLLASVQPNNLVTSADSLQERIPDPAFPNSTLDKPFEIERIPEIGYHRIGDSFGEHATFFSDNTFSGLHYNASKATLADIGFLSARPGRPAVLPGLPSLGTTGTTDEVVYRSDFRQEIDFPFSAGQFKIMPYVEGRYTGYSDSPQEGTVNRFFTGTGVRFNTTFWKVDDSVESHLFDIHRVRHVIEPELHLFTSAETDDRSSVFIYDEPVDAINDVSAASIALHQRWQTKRGGYGNERSVDFFTLNVSADFYANKPNESVLPPGDFRGLFFSSLPEASIPRDAVNSDALWRISDSMALLADAQYNIDDRVLATAGIGLAARFGEQFGYFVGTRYIDDLHSAITTVAAQYELSPKYTIIARESFDFGQQKDVYQSIAIQRKFDRFFFLITFYRDEANNNSGLSFALYPEGLGRGLSTDEFSTVFGQAQ